MKTILTIFALLTLLLVFTNIASAACQPIYGGGQTCTGNNQLTITKSVLNPGTNQLVPNLGINDPKYKPNHIINFQINVQNTGSNTIASYTVKDSYPAGFIFSDALGSFDPNNNISTINGSNLSSGQTVTYTITGRIAPNANSGCVNNQAGVYIGTDANPAAVTASQFCIDNSQQSVQGVQTQSSPTPQPTSLVRLPTTTNQNPSTGLPTEMLLGLLGMGILGGMLRIYSNKI